MAQEKLKLYQISSGDGTNTSLKEKLSQIVQDAGLNTDGSYSPDTNANFVNDASSLKDADSQLDAELKAHEDDTSAHGVTGDVVGTTDAQALTNKTIDADSNTISNIEVDNFKASAIVTEAEGLDSSDNDTTIPTTAAVKDYVDDAVAGLASGLIYQGTFDASAGVYTALANASKGDFYKVSVAGTIDGVDYQIGDMIIVNKDVTGTPVTADLDKVDNTEAADILRIDGGAIKNAGSAIIVDADKNTISNLEVDNFKSGTVSTDNTFDNASDAVLVSQKAIKDYIAAQVAIAVATARTHSITNHTAVADGTNVAVTVTSYTMGNNNLMVFKNGMYLVPGSGEYTETSSTSITVAVLEASDLITIVN